MINGQGEILNQAVDQDESQFISPRVAGRYVSMGAIEINSSNNNT